MSIVKVLEVMSESTKSWEDATEHAIKKVSKTVDNIRSAWVQDQSVRVSEGKVTSYRITLKISFEVN